MRARNAISSNDSLPSMWPPRIGRHGGDDGDVTVEGMREGKQGGELGEEGGAEGGAEGGGEL